jgi:hypothetical protein
MCVASQTDTKTYKLSHATEGCDCDEIGIDSARIQQILKSTADGFPVLEISGDSGDLQSLKISVEPWSQDQHYVALSHASLTSLTTACYGTDIEFPD